jgi:hypothetical protein
LRSRRRVWIYGCVGVYGTAHCFLHERLKAGIMLGYTRLGEGDIREEIRRLSEVL